MTKKKVGEAPKEAPAKSKFVTLYDVNEKAVQILKEDEERFIEQGYRREIPKPKA